MRRPGCVRPDATVNRTNTGTSTMRAAVRALAAFTSGAGPTRRPMGVGSPFSETTMPSVTPAIRRASRHLRSSHRVRPSPPRASRPVRPQVDAVIADDPSAYEIAGAQRGQVRDVGATTVESSTTASSHRPRAPGVRRGPRHRPRPIESTSTSIVEPMRSSARWAHSSSASALSSSYRRLDRRRH